MVLVAVDGLEDRADTLVGAELLVVEAFLLIDRAQQYRDRDAPLAVDLDGDKVLRGGLELQPRAAVGDELRGGQAAAGGRVDDAGEVDARRAHELGDHHPLGAVDDEGAVLRHERQVAHEELLLLDLARLLDQQLHTDAQRRGEGRVAQAALALAVLRFLEPVLAEAQLHAIAREVGDRGDLVEQLAQPRAQEQVVGASRHLDEMRHLEHMLSAPEVLDDTRHGLGGALDGRQQGPLSSDCCRGTRTCRSGRAARPTPPEAAMDVRRGTGRCSGLRSWRCLSGTCLPGAPNRVRVLAGARNDRHATRRAGDDAHRPSVGYLARTAIRLAAHNARRV